MPKFKAVNHVTGETVSFDWDGNKPPSEADVERISDEQRQSRISAKEKIGQQEAPSFSERLLTSPITGAALKGADWLGLNQPWHPVDSLSQMGEGAKQVFTGEGPEANPRIAGANKVIHGAMGTLGPPATALGYAVNPVGMAAGMVAGRAASEGVRAITPDDVSPEVKDLASTGAGLLVGGAAGHYAGRMRSAPETAPPGTDMTVRQKVYGRPMPEDRWSSVENMGPRQLPPGQFERSDVRPPQGPTALPPRSFQARSGGPVGPEPVPPPQLPAAPEPSPVPPFNYSAGRPALPGAPPQGQLQAPGASPIQMPPASIPMPPVGTFEAQQTTEGQFNPPAPKQIAPPGPAPDLVSTAKPEATAPDEVSTVQAPDAPQAALTPEVLPPITPPVLTPQSTQVTPGAAQTPAPPTPPIIPPAPVPAPVRSQSEQTTVPPPFSNPTGNFADIAKSAIQTSKAPVKPPVTSTTPAAPAPVAAPPTVNSLQAQLATLQAENAKLKAVPPPQAITPPSTPPPVAPPPTPTTTGLPQVQSPMDIVRAAMARGKTPKAPESEEPALKPNEQAEIQLKNKVLEWMKIRRDVKPDQIQTQFGLPGDVTKSILNDFVRRGLVGNKNGKFNYVKVRGEDLPTQNLPSEEPKGAEAPKGQPEAASPQIAPNAPETASGEAAPSVGGKSRSEKIAELQKQLGAADDEGDHFTADTIREHLKNEEKNAKLEKTGTPEQKTAIRLLDQVYNRIDEIESKEGDGSNLTEEELDELGTLYKRANKLESQRGSFSTRAKRNLEGPGQAKPKREKVTPFSAKFGSANRVLAESEQPGAKEIGEETPLVEDNKHKFVGIYERKTADIIKDLDKGQRMQVGDILDKFQDPERATGFDPRSIEAAIGLRDIFDEIHSKFPEGIKRGGQDVGYIPNYLTHIKKQFEGDSDFGDIIQDLKDYHLGPFKGVRGLFQGSILKSKDASEQPMGQYGIGNPKSPYTETRTNALEDYERDVKHVLPIYIESAAKAIYDKPWVDEARGLLAKIPDDARYTKELATAYLRNYARYDAYPGLQQAWDTATGRMMRTVGRSVLGFDTRLFVLHGARLFSNIYPELPTKYLLSGIKETAANPIKSYVDAGKMGLLPQNIRPWYFKRPMEKVDSITNAFSVFDFIPDGIAYNGFKKMYMDQGMSSAEASWAAINKTKDVSARVTPARAAKLFSDDLSVFKPFTQFKQQVFKIAEQYLVQPLDAIKRQEYRRLARYIMGVGSMMYMHKKLRISTWHLDPFHLGTFHAAAYDKFYSILKEAGKGNIKKALIDAGLLFVPGGTAIKHQFEKGPSMFEQDNQGRAPRQPKDMDALPALP